jgi:hypothetical protein
MWHDSRAKLFCLCHYSKKNRWDKNIKACTFTCLTIMLLILQNILSTEFFKLPVTCFAANDLSWYNKKGIDAKYQSASKQEM